MTPEQRKTWDAAYEPQNQKFIADMKAGKLTEEGDHEAGSTSATSRTTSARSSAVDG